MLVLNIQQQLQAKRAQIRENITDEQRLIKQKNIAFRELSRQVSTGNKQELVRRINELEANFPQFDYRASYKKNNENSSMLHNACLNQRFEIVRYLIENGHINDINSKNDRGQTPIIMMLINVCTNNFMKQRLFDFLIEKGANILETTISGKRVPDFLIHTNQEFQGKKYIEEVYLKKRSEYNRMTFLQIFNSQSKTTNEFMSNLNHHEAREILSYI